MKIRTGLNKMRLENYKNNEWNQKLILWNINKIDKALARLIESKRGNK